MTVEYIVLSFFMIIIYPYIVFIKTIRRSL